MSAGDHIRQMVEVVEGYRNERLAAIHRKSGGGAIQLLVGPIGSGKSTYARRMAEDGAPILNYDDLLMMLRGEYTYDRRRRTMYHRVQEAIVKAAVAADYVGITIDGTHATKESRKRWVDFGIEEGIAVVARVFPWETPDVHARRRFEHDPRSRSYEHWLAVAEEQIDNLERFPVTPDEGLLIIRLHDERKEIVLYNARDHLSKP